MSQQPELTESPAWTPDQDAVGAFAAIAVEIAMREKRLLPALSVTAETKVQPPARRYGRRP